MKKRIVLSVLVLSLFLFIISCGIPTIFTFSDANDVLTLKSGSLSFSKDDGVFTGNLMFLYFITDATQAQGLKSIQDALIRAFESKYIVNSYNSTNILNCGTSPVISISYSVNNEDKDFKLYQLNVNQFDPGVGNNMQNWASDYMFTLDEGEYTLKYSINPENNNLIISIYKGNNDENVFKQSFNLRCDRESDFNLSNNSNGLMDYTLISENQSSLEVYVIPIIVISAPGYNNKLMYVSSDFATIN